MNEPMFLSFTVPGEPVGKARPRMTRSGHTYTPEKTVSYENLVKLCFKAKYPDEKPAESTVQMVITAYYGIAKSASNKKRQLMADGKIRPIKKPDADNIIKAVADALNGIAYKDDSQIVNVTIAKWYSDTPRVEVAIFREE